MEGVNKKSCVVILGAGFGGLRTAILLSKKIRNTEFENKCEIVLVDKNDYHTYTPTLYEIAATSKEVANYLDLKQIVTFPIKELLKNTSVRFVQGEVEKLDLTEGDIHLLQSGEKLKFNYLVLALGSETNYFDIPGLKENSLALKTFLDALKIRDAILTAMENNFNKIEIVVGGGGSTGVELSGEIMGWLCELEKELKKRNCRAELTLVEASSSVLPGFPESIIERAEKRLKKLGVRVLTNEAIDKAETGKVILKSARELPCNVLVWTGGVKAASLMGALPLKLEKRGRVEVAGEMECLPQSPNLKLYGKIYGLGDAVCFYDPATGKPIPGVARAALVQADVVAHNIAEHIKSLKNHNFQFINYRPKNYPYIVPVGGKWAIAKIGPFVISGFCGWILKGLVELNYLISIMPFWRAMKIWLKGLWIFVQNDRLG